MIRVVAIVRRAFLLAGPLLLAACASFSGYGLKPGAATLEDVVSTMGQPAMRWTDPDGRQQLAYPRGPQATETFMVHIAADGRLERIEPVLDTQHFARIVAGQSDQAAVLRVIGPPQPQWTVYFKERDELAWEWRICDNWGQVAFFGVLFDGTTGIARTTYQRPDSRWPDGRTTSCGHTYVPAE